MNSAEGSALPIRILHDIAGRLEGLNIPYMLTGSMAMFQYSVYRMTADIDLVMELQPRHAQLLINSLEPDYYIPHTSMRNAIESERMFNVLHQETAFKVDCVLRKSTPFQKTAFERRKKVDFHGDEIFIITAEDLIISKLLWAADSKSEKQLTDIKNLLRNPFDSAYIESWVANLGIKDAYEQCLKEIEA
ncbi:MAG: DUF6036 family nucleotidyltransferase [Pyrinomonadaceae bacterium]